MHAQRQASGLPLEVRAVWLAYVGGLALLMRMCAFGGFVL